MSDYTDDVVSRMEKGESIASSEARDLANQLLKAADLADRVASERGPIEGVVAMSLPAPELTIALRPDRSLRVRGCR